MTAWPQSRALFRDGQSAEAVQSLDATARSGECQELIALPSCVNLTLYEGDDVILDIPVVDGDGTPLDFTTQGGIDVRAEIRADPASEDVIAEWEPISVDPLFPNVIRLHLTREANVSMPRHSVWDVQIIWMNLLTTLVAGTITITPEVTRP